MSIRNVGGGLRFWAAVCGLIVGGLCLAGCRTHPAAQQVADSPEASAASATNTMVTGSSGGIFRIGDTLTVTFLDTPTPIPPFQGRIKEDGTIILALNMSFKAEGKTRGELEKEIRAAYVPDYYKQLTVTVTPDITTQWYYVDGEVKVPNRWIYNNSITVTRAIATSGGFTDFANKKKVRLTRADGRTQIINCVKVLTNPKLDPEVYAGDKVHVPRRLW